MYHICYYCGHANLKMSRHFRDVHPDEPDVINILNKKLNSPERTAAFTLLRRKGDFLHNCAVLKEKTGVLIPVRRPLKEDNVEVSDFIPCIYCLGFLLKRNICDHLKTCAYKISKHLPSLHSVVRQCQVILRRMTTVGTNENWEKILTALRSDDVGNYIRNDPTLCTYGNNLTVRDGFEQRKYIRDKLRIIATLC